MADQIIRMSRRNLYNLIWSEPVSKVAARVGLSDNGLRKVCVKHRVPLPQRGYWQKLEEGKKVRPIALPAIRDETSIEFYVGQQAHDEPMADLFAAAEAAEAGFPAIAVSARLVRPHERTAALRDALKGKPDSDGAVHANAPGAFLVRAHSSSVSRVLRIADALAKACEARGFELKKISGRDAADGVLRVVVDGFTFAISIKERFRQERYVPTAAELERRRRGSYVYTPTYQFFPTGQLSIIVSPTLASGLQGVWADTKRLRAEGRLGEVMLGLRKIAAWRRSETLKQEAKQARFEEAQRDRAARRAAIEEERARITQLEAEAAAWRRAEDIRGFIAAKASSHSQVEGGGLQSWVDGASQQADRIDPLRSSPPSIVDTPEVDVAPLSFWSFSFE